MGKLPKILLSAGDIEKAILIKTEDNTSEIGVLDFLNYLEKRYDIFTFPLSYYLPSDKVEKSYWVMLPYIEHELAAMEYISICHYYLFDRKDKNNNEEISKLISEKLENTCWKAIKRIERQSINSNDDFFIHTYVFYYLDNLLALKSTSGDIHSLSRIYHKLINTLLSFERANMTSQILDEIGNSIPTVDNAIINLLSEFMKQDISVILNPINIESYIQAINYAMDDEPCLIYGETGTGKEFVAKTIHLYSQRKKNNFRSVNCGGFTDSLFQSEIQGIFKGAASSVFTQIGVFLGSCQRITGQQSYGYTVDKSDNIYFCTPTRTPKDINRPPSIEELEQYGGTVFLDELNSLNISHQTALLRIVQEKEVLVLGENRPRSFHAKIVSASNADLKEEVQKGNFRADLFHRVSVGEIHLPPLRQYKDYFHSIVQKRVDYIVNKINGDKLQVRKAVINKLKKHNWPGNFRELDNVLYRSIKKAYLENSDVLNASHIEISFHQPIKKDASGFSSMKLDELLRAYYKELHLMSGGNQTQAAEISGIRRNKVRDQWLKLGLHESRPYRKNKRVGK